MIRRCIQRRHDLGQPAPEPGNRLERPDGHCLEVPGKVARRNELDEAVCELGLVEEELALCCVVGEELYWSERAKKKKKSR